MRRAILAALPLAVALVFSAPLGAAAAQLGIEDADVYNQEGQPLTRVALGDPVRLQARVNNTGNSSYNGTLAIVFQITSDDGAYNHSRTITTNQSIPAGGVVNVTMSWVAGVSGRHTLETYVQDEPANNFTLKFVVAQSEVLRAPLAEMVVDYVWVYAAFLIAFVLFVAVARQRRAR